MRRRLGGGVTLGVSVVYLLLLITIFVGLWLTLERQNRAAYRADTYANAVVLVQKLLRGLNEVAVTEGASASRSLASDALKDLAAMRSLLDAGALDRSGRGNFDTLQARTAAFIAEKDVSSSNVEAMITLGRIAADAGKLSDVLTTDAAQARSVESISLRLTRVLLLCAALLALAGTVMSFVVFHRRITRPVSAAIMVAERISSGDLSQPVTTRDAGDIARLMLALKAMQSSLGQVVGEVNTTTDDVVQAAVQLSAGSADLSTRTEEESSTLEQTAASMADITATVRNTSDNSRRASDIVCQAAATARDSDAVVRNAVAKITSIRENSSRISEITNVINSIAFQTNILALNAAVEAARAGEQGRGFSVVASEVRALAQRSATAATEIKSLVAASTSDVEAGAALVLQAGDAMKNILAASEAVVKVVNDISAEMTDQAGRIEQINGAISQMGQATQQNAAVVEQTAKAARAMRDRAEELHAAMGRFKLPSYGGAEVRQLTAATYAPVHRSGAIPVQYAHERA